MTVRRCSRLGGPLLRLIRDRAPHPIGVAARRQHSGNLIAGHAATQPERKHRPCRQGDRRFGREGEESGSGQASVASAMILQESTPA